MGLVEPYRSKRPRSTTNGLTRRRNMKLSELIDYMKIGYDIEFSYNDRRYSIIKPEKKGIRYFSFCEFYKEPTDYASIEEFLASAEIDGEKLTDILGLVTDVYY